MTKQELRSLIREEIRKTLNEAFVEPNRTIDSIINVKRGDIASWPWASIATLNSRNWKDLNQASRFAPLIKQLSKYSNENVVKFFGKDAYNKIEKYNRVLRPDSAGGDPTPQDTIKALDAIYKIVSDTLKSK